MTDKEYRKMFHLLENIQLKLVIIEVMQERINSNSIDEYEKEKEKGECEKSHILNWHYALSNTTLNYTDQLQKITALMQDTISDLCNKNELIKECEI